MKSSTARATAKPVTTTRATNATTNAAGRGSASPARNTGRASPARTPARAGASPARTPARAGASPARSIASPARNRTSLTKIATMSPEPVTATVAPRRSTSSAPTNTRQSATPTRIPTYGGKAPSASRGASSPLSSSMEGNSPGKNPLSAATRIPSPNTVKGISPARNSILSSPKQKPILSHEFLAKTSRPSSRGQSPLNRSIDEASAHQLRRHSAPSSKIQDYMSRSHDHGSLALNRSIDRGPGFVSKSQQQGPKSLTTSQDRGFMSKSQDRGFMSKSQDRGFMSRSQDRGSPGGYANQNAAPRKWTASEYGYDGRRTSTSSRDAPSRQALRFSAASAQGGLNRGDGVSLHLQMGRSVDSTVSLSTAASSPTRARQSFRDSHGERRLIPLQLSDPVMSQGCRSGDMTPDDASPLDGRTPASGLRGGARHRQLKSPDFFDVQKLDGDGGVITAVSRMHHKANGAAQRAEPTGGASSEEDHADANKRKLHPTSEQTYYEQRRDSLANSARKAFNVESESTIGSSHFSSEINFKLEKALNGTQELLEIGSWNDDDEEYLRVFKHERSAGASFVDVMEDKTSDSVETVDKSNNHVEVDIPADRRSSRGSSPSRSKKWVLPEVEHLSQYDNALYQKSEPDSDLGTSTQASPLVSPPRGSPERAPTAAQPVPVSRISSTSATSIDLNRSTDTTCSTYSQYDNSFWADLPINGTFRPWNPNREAEMTPVVAIPPRPSPAPAAELAHPPPTEPSVLLSPREPPVATNTAALNETRMLRYNDGLERLTSYMKTASQSARKKRGLSDDMASSQASGCFDYLVDFLESQTSITDVLVSAHDETLKLNDFAHTAAAANCGAAQIHSARLHPAAVKRLDSKMTNDTVMLSSNRSIESRITDLGSEASWESGKSRSVQTLGSSTGKVMDQITERVDSLSFDSPKHLSTFKFGLKKTTMGACETITSSDQAGKSDQNLCASVPPSRTDSERFFPHRKSVSIPVQQPLSPNLSWPSHTAPSSINASRNASCSPSRRMHPDEKPGGTAHRQPSPLSISSIPPIEIVSGSDELVPLSPSESIQPPIAETLTPAPELSREPSSKKLKRAPSPSHSSPSQSPSPSRLSPVPSSQKPGSASPTVEPPSKNVQMHSDDGSRNASATPDRLVKRDRENLSMRLEQANKGCGCNIL